MRMWIDNLKKKRISLQLPARRLTAAMAAFVLFFSSLSFPVIAEDNDAALACGLEAHTHTAECYPKVLSCGKEESAPETVTHREFVNTFKTHQHTVECGACCGYAENEYYHEHNEYCYDENGNLACGLQVSIPHVHTDACYQTERVLVCDLEENEEHQHSEECYAELNTLVCNIPEFHRHTSDCFDENGQAICGKVEIPTFVCTADNWKTTEEVISEGHTHSDACYTTATEPVCEKPEHVHTEACYSESGTNNSVIGDAVTEGSDTEEPAAGEGTVEEPVHEEEPSADEQKSDASNTEEPINEEPNTKESADEESATDEQTNDEAVTGDKPVNENPAAGDLQDEDPETEETVLFEIEGDMLVRYNGEETIITVPDGIREIGNKAFYENKTIQKIILPDSVQMINNAAFAECANLEKVIISEYSQLAVIGPAAFKNDTRLDITFAQNVQNIVSSAFEGISIEEDIAAEEPAEDEEEAEEPAGEEPSEESKEETEGSKEEPAGETEEDSEKKGEESATETEEDAEEPEEESTDKAEEEILWQESPLVYEGNDYTVTVAFGEDAGFPQGTELCVREILPGTEEYSLYSGQTEEILNENWDEVAEFARFFDITFVFEEQEIEPQAAIDVQITFAEAISVAEDNDLQAIHFAAEGAQVIESDTQSVEAAVSDDTAVDTVAFSSDSFSVYGFVQTAKITQNIIAADGNSYRVEVAYGQDTELPVGAELCVTEIMEDNPTYEAYRQRLVAALDADDVRIPGLFDISILVNGEKKQPSTPVHVTIELLSGLEDGEPLHVVHFPETMDAEAETEGQDVFMQEISADVAANTVSFEAEGFSVYALAYTVDFHWEVNGRTFDFSLPGGGFVSFCSLVETLGIVVQDTEESDAEQDVSAFMVDVENVEFSDPELVSVSRVETDTTVGELKEALDLEIEYSEELTEEQIVEINETAVQAGDWALISVYPFTNEEMLTVTMRNGETFKIRVTDAQINREYISASGETYKITVLFDDNAEIPEDAELRVLEIPEGTESYDEYLNKAVFAANKKLTDKEDNTAVSEYVTDTVDDVKEDEASDLNRVSYARFFDISIWNADAEIEPKAAVTIKIELADAQEEQQNLFTVVHFEENGPVVMDVDVRNATDIRVETESFSVYGVLSVSNPSTGVNDLNGRTFMLDYNGAYMTTNAGREQGLDLLETGTQEYAALWQFEAVGDSGQSGQYRIFTLVDGERQYLNLDQSSISWAANGKLSSEPQMFTVKQNGGKYQLSAVSGENTFYLSGRNINGHSGFSGLTDDSREDTRFNLTFTQPVVQLQPDTYAVIIKNDETGKYYAVQNDGSLAEVEYSIENNTAYVNLGNPPLAWTYTGAQDGIGEDGYSRDGDALNDRLPYNLRLATEARGYEWNQLPRGKYYRYISPMYEEGVFEESESNPNHGGYNGYNNYLYSGAKWYNGLKYENNKLCDVHFNNGNFVSNGYYIGADFETMHITGKRDADHAATVFFAKITGLPDVGEQSETVSHIDIGVYGSVDVEMPLVAGKYYDEYGNLVCEATKQNRLKGNLKADNINVDKDDIIAGTLVATDKNGNIVEDAFKITGYTSNSPTENSPYSQVRMEGSFKVDTLTPGGGGNYDENWRHRRMQNEVYYKFTTSKKVTLPVYYSGIQLYDKDGNPILINTTIQLSQSFSYWDERNECPPLQYTWERLYHGSTPEGQAYRHWRDGYIIYAWSEDGGDSGMDFVLGDRGGEAEGLAIQVVKMIVDENNNPITPNRTVSNTFYVYYNPTGDPHSVINTATNINSPASDDPADEAGYSELQSAIAGFQGNPVFTSVLDIEGGNTGSFYDYDVESGLFYVKEDSTPIQEGGANYTITDTEGKQWTYKRTYTETEYVWRGENSPSYHYANGYTCVPDVLGEYLGNDGSYLNNTFLEFYIYNVYESEPANIKVKKEWKNISATAIPDNASVEIELRRYRLDDIYTPTEKGVIHITQSVTGEDAGTSGFAATYTLKKDGQIVGSATYNSSAYGALINNLDPGEYTIEISPSVKNGYRVTADPIQQNVTVTADTVTEVEFVCNVDIASIPRKGIVWIHSDGENNWSGHMQFDYNSYYQYDSGIPVTLTFDNHNAYYNPYSGCQVIINGVNQGTMGPGSNSFIFITRENDTATGIGVEILVTGTDYNNWSNIFGSYVMTLDPEGTPVSGPADTTRSMNNANGTRALRSSLRASTGVTNTKDAPVAPEGKEYVDDGWSYTVTLANGTWEKIVGGQEKEGVDEVADGLVRHDTNGNDYLYYIASVSETNVPDGTVVQIDSDGDYVLTRTGVPLDQLVDALPLTATNILPITAQIKGTKQVTNATGDYSGYGFTLAGESNMPDSGNNLAVSAADGSFEFDEITYSLTDLDGESTKTFTYEVTENIPDVTDAERAAGFAIRNGIKYDASVKTVTVTLTNNAGTLSAAVSPDQVGLLFTNEELGALKFTKNVTVEGPHTDETLADGEYTFTVTGPGTKTTVNKTVTIKVTNGQATQYKMDSEEDFTDLPADKYVLIPNLSAGDYTITETGKNGLKLDSISRGDKKDDGTYDADPSPVDLENSKVIVHVTAGDTVGPTANAVFTNKRIMTELNVSKVWDSTSPEDHPTSVTFKVYRVGHYMDGEEQKPSSEGFYPDNDTVYTINGNAPTKVENLPADGYETVAGVEKYVEYTYHVTEMPVGGDTVYWPSYTIGGTNVTITNTPVTETEHETELSVTKSWLDKNGEDANAAHEKDEIEFTLKQVPHPTGYVPVTLLYVNADGSTWKQQEIFVKKGEKLSFTFRKGTTLYEHLIEIREGSQQSSVGGRGTSYTYITNALNDATSITARQTFSYTRWSLFNGFETFYDTWGDQVVEGERSYQWTSEVSASGGTLYTDYDSFYNALSVGTAGEANEYVYTLGRTSIAPEDAVYPGSITGDDWNAGFEHLPEFQKVGNEFVIFTYEISELKIKPDGEEDEQTVAPTTIEGYQGETTDYLVQWSNDGTDWSITNREKPGIDIDILKVDDKNQALGDAVFEIYKKKESTFEKMTQSTFDWLDENDRFTVTTSGFTLTGLKDGVYKIKEITPPTGYVIENEEPVEFTVAHGAIVESSNILTEGVTYTPASGTDKDKFSIPNTPGTVLPSTGGSGTLMYTLSGLAIILLAGTLLALRRKRSRI